MTKENLKDEIRQLSEVDDAQRKRINEFITRIEMLELENKALKKEIREKTEFFEDNIYRIWYAINMDRLDRIEERQKGGK